MWMNKREKSHNLIHSRGLPGLWESRTEATESSWLRKQPKKAEKISFKGWSEHHLSCQNNTRSPKPTSKPKWEEKTSQPILMCFQRLQPWVPQGLLDLENKLTRTRIIFLTTSYKFSDNPLLAFHKKIKKMTARSATQNSVQVKLQMGMTAFNILFCYNLHLYINQQQQHHHQTEAVQLGTFLKKIQTCSRHQRLQCSL